MGWSAVTAIDDKKPASTSLRIVIELVGAPLTAQKPAALAASRAA
jgi:hypothetical protein